MHHRDGYIVNYVNATQFAAQMFGGLENLITLSLSLSLSLSQALAYKRNSTTSYYSRGSPASRYGFSCNKTRETALFFIPRDKDFYQHITINIILTI